MYALEPDLLGCRNHDAANVLGNRTSAQDIGRGAHILDTAVGTRTDNGLVDRDMTALGNGMRIAGQMRPGHARLDLGSVDLDDLLILGIRIG